MTSASMPRHVTVVIAEGLATSLVVLAAWLGSHEFVGTNYRGAISCGSVWGLPPADLNGTVSCEDPLSWQILAVAGLVGAAGIVALMTPLLVLGRFPQASGRGYGGVASAVAVAVSAVAIVLVIGIAGSVHPMVGVTIACVGGVVTFMAPLLRLYRKGKSSWRRGGAIFLAFVIPLVASFVMVVVAAIAIASVSGA